MVQQRLIASDAEARAGEVKPSAEAPPPEVPLVESICVQGPGEDLSCHASAPAPKAESLDGQVDDVWLQLEDEDKGVPPTIPCASDGGIDPVQELLDLGISGDAARAATQTLRARILTARELERVQARHEEVRLAIDEFKQTAFGRQSYAWLHGRGWALVPHFSTEAVLEKTSSMARTVEDKLLHKVSEGHFEIPENFSAPRINGEHRYMVDEIEQRCARLQSTEEGMAYQKFLMDQGPAKKARSEAPFWFDYATDEQKKDFIAVVASKATALEQIDMYDTCKQKLESVGQFATRDKIEFANRVKDAQRRASGANNMLTSAPVDNSTVCVARPIDESIDPETGLIIATHKCDDSVRGPETSICNEAAKMGVKVGDKAGQVGKVAKRLYGDRYGVEASLNIPKRHTTFRGKPFEERSYHERDADLIQQAIRIVCGAQEKPRQSTTQTLLNFAPSTLRS